ncbi:ATP-binding cassette domain-containing protein [Cryobacterium frigoriphilum]|uniref:ATP-binding cassette domain-containing protein n=1 Tax=Cryobacterium frigoriphilum TaxID=1259150 RepID=A0A4R8ZUC2_9MICO|nr:ATP-binding cassette domain-containing protein [Cryobacterium frigoriphilum]TFD46346.1 ATP-binding cassette domain-containing protein [Cryobacterium frigoriphilum]
MTAGGALLPADVPGAATRAEAAAATGGPQLLARLGESRLTLTPGDVVSVGRGSDCGISVEHELVSREHAVVFYSDGWVVADRDSRNGLFLNGERFGSTWVGDGIDVRLGDAETGPLLAPATRPDGPAAWEQHDAVAEHTVLSGRSAQPFRSEVKQLAVAPAGASVITVGVAADNTLRLDDVLVSRHHARVTESGDGFIVEDTNSLNGTYLNGQLISTAYMRDGDRLTVGHHDFLRTRGQLIPAREALPDSGGLDVWGLTFAIASGKKLLFDIDLSARRGTLTAVIGPSGAGKSTLAKVLTGIARPSGGAVRFDDFDVHDNYDLVKARIGLVPQEDVLHRQLTVKRALGYAARLRLSAESTRRSRAAQIARVVTQLGLPGHESTRIDRLSGGQRKRASVALELLTEPSLLVLDEPTSGLDPALDRQVMHTLRELADGDRAVVVITHSVAYLELCDQILVLAPGGMPAYLGSLDGLKAHFATDDWAVIFGRVAEDPARAHAAFRSSVPAARLAPVTRPEASASVRAAKPSGATWLTQLITLAARQFSLILADAGYLTFLAVLPVALGLLALVVPGDSGFTAPDLTDTETLGEPSQLLALLTVGACFMGASMSIRDLVGERVIFRRERAVGLRVSAYLLSKIVVFGLFSWLSAAVLVTIVFLGKAPPNAPVLLHDAKLELFIAMGVTASTSMILGLLISALVRSSEQAMPVLIVILMTQLVLHGGLIPVTGRAVLDALSWLVPARWGFAAAASGIDLNGLIPSLEVDPLWKHEPLIWLLSLAVLTVFSVVFASLTLLLLKPSSRRGSHD